VEVVDYRLKEEEEEGEGEGEGEIELLTGEDHTSAEARNWMWYKLRPLRFKVRAADKEMQL
jgi:hypothetical protein